MINPVSLDIIKVAAEDAFKASQEAVVAKGSVGGCGRVYVEFGDTLRKGGKVAKVLEKAGFKMFSRPYWSGVHLYVGYDNASGREFAVAENIVATFKAHGIACYVDGDGD